MRKIITVLVLCMLVACSSDGDEDQLKKYNEYIVGDWVQVFQGNPYRESKVYRINNNGTGTWNLVEKYENGKYKLKNTNPITDISIFLKDDVYKFYYKIEKLADREFTIKYLDRDSLVIYEEGFPFRKIENLIIEE